eukprot:scaffold28154_cov56-Phaeocystis_antarctica.AAC.2
MVSMYPEDSSRALKVHQEHHQVGRVAHQVPTFEIEGTIISRLRRPTRLEPSRSHSAHRALCDREGGECWHVRPRMLYVPSTKRASGRNNAQTPQSQCTASGDRR